MTRFIAISNNINTKSAMGLQGSQVQILSLRHRRDTHFTDVKTT